MTPTDPVGPSTPPGAPKPRKSPQARPPTPSGSSDLEVQLARLQSAVAGLASEVEAMRRGMRTVATSGELDRVAATVAELSETVAVMQAVNGKPRESEAIPSWLTLPRELRNATDVLSDLKAWMRDVYLRYADAARDLPECWLWHPDIVEELVWLQYAWLSSYRDDNASVRAAGDWHDRLRPGVVRRIHSYARTCSLENHLTGRPNATGAPHLPVADDDHHATSAIAAWWTDARDQPAPEPTHSQMTAVAAAARRARTGTTTTASVIDSDTVTTGANR